MLDAFLRLLSGERPEERVWTADISYWIAGWRYRGDAPSAWETEEGYLQLCRSLGIMPYYWYGQFWLAEPEYDETIHLSVERRGDVSVREWITPAGALREEHRFLPSSCSTGCTRFPVQTERDLRAWIYLIEHRRLRPSSIDDYRERMILWRQYDGLPSIALPRSPLAAFFYEWAGVENAVYLLADEPELVEHAFQLMDEQEAPILDAVRRLAPPLVHFADNLSSENMAGLYDRYLAPTHRRRLDALHDAGVRCAVHLDGTVKGLLPKLAAIGFDAVEALTPQPAGDATLEEMRSLAGDRLVLWGGLPGVMFAPPFTWSDMEMHMRRLMEDWDGARYIVGVADQVPPDGDIDLCRLVADRLR